MIAVYKMRLHVRASLRRLPACGTSCSFSCVNQC